MLNQSVLGLCIVLEGSLLIRGFQSNLLKRFPLFYFYVGCVLARDLLGTPIYMHYRSFYEPFYWTTDLLASAISYIVLVEIYSHSLKNYPGAAKLFRVLLFVIFFAVVVQVAVSALGAAQPSAIRAVADLDSNLRELQAMLLLGLLALLAYYKIPLGRNLRGLLLGYALFIGADVITLTLVAHPTTEFALRIRSFETLTYVIALVVWSISLWTPSPEVVSRIPCRVEEDYERLARETRMILLRARTHLARAGRP